MQGRGPSGQTYRERNRISVELILAKLSREATIPDLLQAYPHLTQQDILAALTKNKLRVRDIP